MRKYLLIIGSQNSYFDSFRLFEENGYQCHVVKVPHELQYFIHNYESFAQLGFAVHESLDKALAALAAQHKAHPFDTGLVVSGAHYYGEKDVYLFGDHTIRELEHARTAKAQLAKMGPPVFYARLCCGETFFVTPERARLFARLCEPVDAFVTHTANLQRYIKHNCPELADTPFLQSPLNAPLARYAQREIPDAFYERMVYMGRLASLRNPAVPLPVDEITFKTQPMYLACGGPLHALEHDRRMALMRVSCYRLALGHFYDFYDNGAQDAEEILFGATERQHIQRGEFTYFLPKLFRLTNVAGKVLTYLLFGVPPVVPDDPGSDFHMELLRRGMAIPVGADRKIPRRSDRQLRDIRRNILRNIDLFTFDPTFHALNGLVEFSA